MSGMLLSPWMPPQRSHPPDDPWSLQCLVASRLGLRNRYRNGRIGSRGRSTWSIVYGGGSITYVPEQATVDSLVATWLARSVRSSPATSVIGRHCGMYPLRRHHDQNQ